MNSWKIILATVVIFGAGVMTGGLLVNYVVQARSGGHHPHRPADFTPSPEILKTNFVQCLDNAVHLTPQQRGKIEKIIAEGQERNHELWKLVFPQFRSVILDVRRHIRDTLTPAQQKQFDELVKRPARRHSNGTNAPPASKPGHSPAAGGADASGACVPTRPTACGFPSAIAC